MVARSIKDQRYHDFCNNYIDSGSTREMIKKDKQRWKTKSYQVENLNEDQARNMLNVNPIKF